MTRRYSSLVISLIMIVMFSMAFIDSVARRDGAPGVTYEAVGG